jgi:hypothetical protein
MAVLSNLIGKICQKHGGMNTPQADGKSALQHALPCLPWMRLTAQARRWHAGQTRAAAVPGDPGRPKP